MEKTIKIIFFTVLIVLLVCFINWVYDDHDNSNYSYSSNSKSNNTDGFVGSDGKYHNYVPEFGDDVNNCMKDNW